MARFNIDIGFTRKVPIADEVISSAFRVLATAGFSDDEIRTLFLRAGGEIETSEPVEVAEHEPDDNEDVYFGDSQYEFEEELEKTSAYRALQRLAKRHEQTWQYDSEQDLTKAFEGLREAIPHGEELQSWIRQNAPRFGLTVHDSRDRWVEAATDEELDRERSFAFLDDWRLRSPFSWEIASSVARDFARRGMKYRLEELQSLLSSSNMTFPDDIATEIESAVRETETFETFKTYLRSLSGSGELMRSQVTDEFCRTAGSVQTYLLDGWLDTIASQDPSIQVYKRSNRWRLMVD